LKKAASAARWSLLKAWGEPTALQVIFYKENAGMDLRKTRESANVDLGS
jgi:hypothetical protein